MRMLTMKE